MKKLSDLEDWQFNYSNEWSIQFYISYFHPNEVCGGLFQDILDDAATWWQFPFFLSFKQTNIYIYMKYVMFL